MKSYIIENGFRVTIPEHAKEMAARRIRQKSRTVNSFFDRGYQLKSKKYPYRSKKRGG